jgi:hypothetical protein
MGENKRDCDTGSEMRSESEVWQENAGMAVIAGVPLDFAAA